MAASASSRMEGSVCSQKVTITSARASGTSKGSIPSSAAARLNSRSPGSSALTAAHSRSRVSRDRPVAPESFEHGVDKIAELRFQLLRLDARLPFTDEFDPGVRRFVSPPPETYPLRCRHHGQARENETVAGKRQVVPALETGVLLPRVLDLVEEVPPVADQPLRNMDQGDDDVIPPGAARTVEHGGDGRAAHLDGKRGHGVAGETIRRRRGVDPIEAKTDAHDSPLTRCSGLSGYPWYPPDPGEPCRASNTMSPSRYQT